MKSRNKQSLSIVCSIAVVLTIQAQVVTKTDVRQSLLTSSDALLAIKQPSMPLDAVDPFYSTAFSEAMGQAVRPASSEAPRVGPRSDREVLEAISAQLKPTGNFVLNGQQTLFFGQKRVKAGMPMTINFEGIEYAIEITAIDRTSFTLRLNREELTRPIK